MYRVVSHRVTSHNDPPQRHLEVSGCIQHTLVNNKDGGCNHANCVQQLIGLGHRKFKYNCAERTVMCMPANNLKTPTHTQNQGGTGTKKPPNKPQQVHKLQRSRCRLDEAIIQDIPINTSVSPFLQHLYLILLNTSQI